MTPSISHRESRPASFTTVAASSARRAVVPGSFDPVTCGHLDIIERVARLVDEVTVAILHNPDKNTAFTVAERLAFLAEQTQAWPNVSVAAFTDTLLVDVCTDLQATMVVKGVRGGADVEYEMPMASMNRHLSGIETLFLPANPALAHISSSLVKEISRYGADVTAMVPDPVRDALAARRQ